MQTFVTHSDVTSGGNMSACVALWVSHELKSSVYTNQLEHGSDDKRKLIESEIRCEVKYGSHATENGEATGEYLIK